MLNSKKNSGNASSAVSGILNKRKVAPNAIVQIQDLRKPQKPKHRRHAPRPRHFHRLRHLHSCGMAVTVLMIALGICDGMYSGAHDFGSAVRTHKLAYFRQQRASALADGSVIVPHVSEKVKHGFADEFARLDEALPKNEQITPSLVIAQAALESDWGQSELYKQANNPFGVKGDYHGQYMTYFTNEDSGDGSYTEMSDFRQYPTLEDAVRDHNGLLKKKFLQGSDGDSYVSEAKALQDNGYATDPNYARKLMDEVQNNNLMRFD